MDSLIKIKQSFTQFCFCGSKDCFIFIEVQNVQRPFYESTKQDKHKCWFTDNKIARQLTLFLILKTIKDLF